ncbi:class I SAM-dependent methyltransferase [Candidatus Parabeggiatoa sp. HSG14]|uniref:class I SAM-dependent methyltransferase n=1 Tax=Candidatus Parabeggiatoa sp. HSG14 TaxID=3055593 RepID=UPI0025A6DC03|nr:class I SAM-dependent methyltransferase [Thiotrichales bacterium HSG14]
MKTKTLNFLRCIHPLTDSEYCDSELKQRDELTLICKRCGAEYSLRGGIPRLIHSNISENPYLKEEMIGAYYEMQFAPYILTGESQDRLSYPQSEIVTRSFEKNFYQSVTHLMGKQNLTEDFYQSLLELVRQEKLVTPNTTVLDIGCGLGRMTTEMARFDDVDYAIGLDSSAFMIEEATKLANSQQSQIPIKLNLVGGKTTSAKIGLDWTVDNCDFMVGDAQQLALQEGAFDLVLCLNVIDRVPNPTKVIEQIFRVLKSGGYLIITDPYDWENSPITREYWITDMAEFFSHNSKWQQVQEVDGIPFVMRSTSRQIVAYMNHCLIYRKITEETQS